MKSMDINFVFSDNYKQEFKEYVNNLYALPFIEVDEKKGIIQKLTDAYILASYERPAVVQLDRLSTWLLKGLEKDDSDAVVLTERQMRRRIEEQEVSFHTPEDRYFHLETDGNKLIKKAPAMDSNQSHKTTVKLLSDNEDQRQFNGPLRKYFMDLI